MQKHMPLIIGIIVAFYFLLGPNPMTGQVTPAHALRQDAKLVTHAVALGLSGLLKNVESREDQIKLLQDFVHTSRFHKEDSGYFYVVEMTGIMIAHGTNPELEGVDMSQQTDLDGLFIFKESIKLLKNGGGFIDYKWTKPGAAGVFKKLGYVEPIPGTNFFLGSGVYYPSTW